ncbi:RodZ domain-containing protein [Marinimicrobium sp. C2-29]|uniref:RodZ domain-containing protein n=1 Tax=Marinimicrobium sp. C2-29 TaxID=3139825 RepID=UPI003139660C
MTDEENRPEESEPAAPSDFTPPGALLKAAREEAQLKEEDVARELRMTVSKVRALEADDYAQLHSDTFVRGYLRTYAKLLKLDADEVLQAYKQARLAAGLEEEEEESPLQINVPEPSRPLWRFALWIVILLVGLWALSVWFLGNQPSSTGGEAAMNEPVAELGLEQPVAPSPADSESPSGEGGQVIDMAADQTSLDESATGMEETPSESESADTPTDTEALASTRVQSGQGGLTGPELLDQLTLTFDEECWLEVTDSRGDILAVDLVLEGRTLSLSGKAPFDVKMGNARAVNVELNGDPVEFDVPQGRRTMTLTVN